jgi:hypothetical protein
LVGSRQDYVANRRLRNAVVASDNVMTRYVSITVMGRVEARMEGMN